MRLVGRGKSPKPSELWAFLKVLATKNGEIAIKDPEAKTKYKKQKELLKKWPRFLKKDEVQVYLEKRKKEYQSLLKLISELSLKRQKEIVNLWLDVQDGFTKEGRFLRQLDKVENLLQALEYYNKDKCFPMEPWWVQVKETIDDPLLLEFIEALSQKFYKKKS